MLAGTLGSVDWVVEGGLIHGVAEWDVLHDEDPNVLRKPDTRLVEHPMYSVLMIPAKFGGIPWSDGRAVVVLKSGRW